MKKKYIKKLSFVENLIENFKNLNLSEINKAFTIIKSQRKNNKIILCGNGASASIANHISVDLTKAAKKRAITFNESNLITCYSNDFKYENWLKEAIKSYALKNDILILISSSGRSKNVINAGNYARKIGLKVITLSGFNKNNPLKKIGHVNIHVDSKNYNLIEVTHLGILCQIVETLIKK